MNTTYWRSAAEDKDMQDEHGFIWTAMLDTIDNDLAGKRVLDAGCNRARSSASSWTKAASPKASAMTGIRVIEDARRLAGRRPLDFEAADTVPAGGTASMPSSATRCSTCSTIFLHVRPARRGSAPGGVYYCHGSTHRKPPDDGVARSQRRETAPP